MMVGPPTIDLNGLEACRRGDRQGLRLLFEAYKDRVYSLALHFTGDRSAAWDVTQDVFLKIFAAIPEFRNEAKFETWLYRIVANACIDERRKRRRFVPLETHAQANHLVEYRPQEAGCIQHQVAEAVRTAVTGLAPALRLPILLRYVEELSYEEIAEVLGCKVGTVAARLSRGHKILARKLAGLRGAVR